MPYSWEDHHDIRRIQDQIDFIKQNNGNFIKVNNFDYSETAIHSFSLKGFKVEIDRLYEKNDKWYKEYIIWIPDKKQKEFPDLSELENVGALFLKKISAEYNFKKFIEKYQDFLASLLNAAKNGEDYYEVPEDRPSLSNELIRFLQLRGFRFACTYGNLSNFVSENQIEKIQIADRVRIYW